MNIFSSSETSQKSRFSYTNLAQKNLVSPILNTLISPDSIKNSGNLSIRDTSKANQCLVFNFNVKQLNSQKKAFLPSEKSIYNASPPLKNRKLDVSTNNNSPPKLSVKISSPIKLFKINSQHTENDELVHSEVLHPETKGHMKKLSLQVSGVFGNNKSTESLAKPTLHHRTLSLANAINNQYLFQNNSPNIKYNNGHREGNLGDAANNMKTSNANKISSNNTNMITPIFFSNNKIPKVTNLLTAEMILNR